MAILGNKNHLKSPRTTSLDKYCVEKSSLPRWNFRHVFLAGMFVPFFFKCQKRCNLANPSTSCFLALKVRPWVLTEEELGAQLGRLATATWFPRPRPEPHWRWSPRLSKMGHFSVRGKLLVIYPYPYRPFWPNEIIFHQPRISLK